jgi:ATP-dependent HslUV protease ATP-binding subunit HslU
METEDIRLTFAPDGVDAIAGYAQKVNDETDNIGARRLHTLMEHLLEQILFDGVEAEDRSPVVNRAYVDERLRDIVEDHDLSRSVL